MGAIAARYEHRQEPRDEVYHRAPATVIRDNNPLTMLVVNLSPGGLMARCDAPLTPGDRFRVVLPIAGLHVAEVRWALGGRIGCQFEKAIPLLDYAHALAAMR